MPIIVQPTTIRNVTVGAPIGPINLPGSSVEGLTDVEITSLSDGQYLKYVLADLKWKNVDLQSEIDSDLNVLQLQITGNDSDILSLFNGDSDLQAQITNHQAQLDSEELRVDLLSGRVDSAEADIVTLSVQIAANDSDILTIQQLNAIIQGRIDSNENYFNDRLAAIDSDIANLPSGGGGGDSAAIANLQSQIDSNETFFKGRINSDSDARVAGDASLQAQIDSNETVSKNTDSDLNTSISQETTARTAGDASLQSQIDSNESFFRGLHDSAETAWETADVSLQSQIDSNETLSKNTDSNLLSSINSEISARVAGDVSLQSQIDSNESFFKSRINSDSDARVTGDTALQAQVTANDSDITALEASAASLQSQITANDSDILALQGQSPAGLQAQITANDSDILALQGQSPAGLQTQIDSNELMFRSRLDSAETAWETADASLQSQITANDSDILALQTVNTSLQSQITDNDSDILALQTADASLQSQITNNDSDITALETTDTALQAQVTANDSDITALEAADASLQSQIDSNETFFRGLHDSAEGAWESTNTALQAQVTANDSDILALQTVNTSLQSQIDSNETALESADIALQNQITANDSDITVLQTADASLQAQIDSNETFFRGLHDSAEAVRLAAEASLQAQITANDSDIGSLQGASGIDSGQVVNIISTEIDSNDFVGITGNEAVAGEKTFVDRVAIKVGDATFTPETDLHIRSGGYSRGWAIASDYNLIIEKNAGSGIVLATDGASASTIQFADSADVNPGAITYLHDSDTLALRAGDDTQFKLYSTYLKLGTPDGHDSGILRTEGGIYDYSTSGNGGYASFRAALSVGGAEFNAYSGTDSANTFIDFNAPRVATGDVTIRYFRETNTTGLPELIIYPGDGTGNVVHRFGQNKTNFNVSGDYPVVIGSDNVLNVDLDSAMLVIDHTNRPIDSSPNTEQAFFVSHAAATNDDYLAHISRRDSTGGTSWTSNDWRIQRSIDTTRMGYVEFGNGTVDAVNIGTGANNRIVMMGQNDVLFHKAVGVNPAGFTETDSLGHALTAYSADQNTMRAQSTDSSSRISIVDGNTTGSNLVAVASRGNTFEIQTGSGITRFTIDSTGQPRFINNSAILLPKGASAQRPDSAENGLLRYNTDSNVFEGYINGAWSGIGSGGGGITQEAAEDAIAAMIAAGSHTNIAIAYADGVPSLTFDVEQDLSQYDNSTSNFATVAQAGDNWSDPLNANIIPDSASSRNIGSVSSPIASIHCDEIIVNGVTIAGDTTTDPDINSIMVWDDSAGSYAWGTTNYGVEINSNVVQLDSNYRSEIVTVCLFDNTEDVATGDVAGGQVLRIPSKLNNWNLIEAVPYCYTAGVTGATQIQVRNITDAVDMLTTHARVDSGETEGVAGIINTSNDDVATGDQIGFDVDSAATGTPLKGLWMQLTFRAP